MVSFIGMATQEVAIKQTVNITLKSDAEVLEEVVVTGYGVQRKASFTGAAAIIGEDVIAKKSDANFVKALEGAVPGVQMSNSTSMPGYNTPRFSDRHNYGGMTRNRYICKKEENQNGKTI